MDLAVPNGTKNAAEWITQLEDQKVSKRDEALNALGEKGDPTAVDPILVVLGKETNENTRRAAVRALGEIGDPRAAAPLLEVLRGEKSAFIRKAAVFALGKLKYAGSIQEIGRLLREDPEYEVRYAAVWALSRMEDPQAVAALREALNGKVSENLRGQIVTTLGEMKAEAALPDIEIALFSDKAESVRRAAVKALVGIRGTGAVPAFANALKNEHDPKVVLRIVEQLGELASPQAIPALCSSLLEAQSPELRKALSDALKKTPDWQLKANQLLQALQNADLERDDLPVAEIVGAIAPPAEELSRTPHMLTDLLVKNTVGKDKRMTDILAALIVASSGNNLSVAGERINALQREGLASEALESLRIQVGGETALDPWMKMLSEDLRTYFREPIKNLNDSTQTSWQNMVRYAQYGFIARMAMSVVVFILGVLLISVSSYRFMFATLNTQQMFGNGVSFISGLGTMLLIIYTGPLKEIRTAVDDLGTASAAFIAYVHRVLQTSHTYSFYYLERKINFEEMKKSSALIEDAMNNTVEKLGGSQKRGSEQVLRAALDELSKQNQKQP